MDLRYWDTPRFQTFMAEIIEEDRRKEIDSAVPLWRGQFFSKIRTLDTHGSLVRKAYRVSFASTDTGLDYTWVIPVLCGIML